MIDEINEKVENLEDRLLELPKLINEANESLMLMSMDYFSEKIGRDVYSVLQDS